VRVRVEPSALRAPAGLIMVVAIAGVVALCALMFSGEFTQPSHVLKPRWSVQRAHPLRHSRNNSSHSRYPHSHRHRHRPTRNLALITHARPTTPNRRQLENRRTPPFCRDNPRPCRSRSARSSPVLVSCVLAVCRRWALIGHSRSQSSQKPPLSCTNCGARYWD
jgi:hypothetical protein